jgi:AbrB family looped-hinge helix DNA binding protein
MVAVSVSSKGQVVIPKEVRDALGIRQGEQLEVAVEGDRIVLSRPSGPPAGLDWRRWRGFLRGTNALEEHLAEHRAEVDHDRLP